MPKKRKSSTVPTTMSPKAARQTIAELFGDSHHYSHKKFSAKNNAVYSEKNSDRMDVDTEVSAKHNENLKNANHENKGKEEEECEINLQKSDNAKAHAEKLVEDFLTNPSIQIEDIGSPTSPLNLTCKPVEVPKPTTKPTKPPMLFFSPRQIDLSSGTYSSPMLNSLLTANQSTTADTSVKYSSQTVSSMRNVSIAVSEHSPCSIQNPPPTSGPKQIRIRPSIFIPQDGNSRPSQAIGRHRFTSEMFPVNPSMGQGAIYHNNQLDSKAQVSILPASSKTPHIRMGNLTPEVEIFTKPRAVPVSMPPQSISNQSSVADNVRYRKIMPMARSGSQGFVSVRPMAFLQTDMQNRMQIPSARMQIPPARMEIPPARMAIPPARMTIPPARMKIPSARMEIPPARMEIPSARMAIPPARMEIPSARMEIPPARMAIPPARMEIPSARMAIPPARMQIPPARMEIPSARTEIPPARMAIPPTRMAIPPARMEMPPMRMGIPTARMGISSVRMGVPPARIGNPSGTMGIHSVRLGIPPARGPSLPIIQVMGPKLFPKLPGSSQNLSFRQIAPAPNQGQFAPRPSVSTTRILDTTASYRDKVQSLFRQNIPLPQHPVPQDLLRHPNSSNIGPSSNVMNIPSGCTSFPTFPTSQQCLSIATPRIPSGEGLASHITNLKPSQQALNAVTSQSQFKQNSQFLVLNQSNAKGTLQVFQTQSQPAGPNQGSARQLLPAPPFSTGNQSIDPTRNFLSKICRVTTAQNKDSEDGIKPTKANNNNISISRKLKKTRKPRKLKSKKGTKKVSLSLKSSRSIKTYSTNKRSYINTGQTLTKPDEGKWRFDPEASGVSVGTPFQPEVRMSSSLHKTIINSLFFRGAAGVKKQDHEAAEDSVQNDPLNSDTTLTSSDGLTSVEAAADPSPGINATAGKKYRCTWCTRYYQTLTLIKEHDCTPRFTCVDCPTSLKFRTRSLLTDHLAEEHPNLSIKCPHCRLISGSKTNLLRHIRRVHDDIGEPSDNDLFPVLNPLLEKEGRVVSSEQDKENINSNSSSPNLRPESNDTTNKPIDAPAKPNFQPSIFDEDEIAEKDADTAEPNVEDGDFELFSFLERVESPKESDEPSQKEATDVNGAAPNEATDKNRDDQNDEMDKDGAVPNEAMNKDGVSIEIMNEDASENEVLTGDAITDQEPKSGAVKNQDEKISKSSKILESSEGNLTEAVLAKSFEKLAPSFRTPRLSQARALIPTTPAINQSNDTSTHLDIPPPSIKVLEEENETYFFSCSSCSKQFKTNARYAHHLKVCAGEIYKTYQPSRTRNRRMEEFNRMEDDLYEVKEMCLKCCRPNYKEINLEEHLKKCRGNFHRNTKVSCPFCKNPKRFFQTQSMLKGHIAILHAHDQSRGKWKEIQKKQILADELKIQNLDNPDDL